jgi:hypothetical protein
MGVGSMVAPSLAASARDRHVCGSLPRPIALIPARRAHPARPTVTPRSSCVPRRHTDTCPASRRARHRHGGSSREAPQSAARAARERAAGPRRAEVHQRTRSAFGAGGRRGLATRRLGVRGHARVTPGAAGVRSPRARQAPALRVTGYSSYRISNHTHVPVAVRVTAQRSAIRCTRPQPPVSSGRKHVASGAKPGPSSQTATLTAPRRCRSSRRTSRSGPASAWRTALVTAPSSTGERHHGRDAVAEERAPGCQAGFRPSRPVRRHSVPRDRLRSSSGRTLMPVPSSTSRESRA